MVSTVNMDFHSRFHPFSGHELAELVAISPDDAAMQQVRRGDQGVRQAIGLHTNRHTRVVLALIQ